MDVPISLVLRTLATRYGWLVALLTLSSGAAAGGYAFVSPRNWMAHQTLVVRDEILGTPNRPGRFDSAEQLRSAQETVRTVARSREVISSVLSQVEPPPGYTDSEWPSQEYLEDYGANISISAANGAEFGQTEVVVLSVKDRSAERAAQIVAYLTHELSLHLSQLRDARFGSMEQELGSGLEVAQESVDQASLELSRIERELGADLSEMRSMNDPSGSEGPLRRQLGTTRQDIVTAQQRLGDLSTQLTYLQELAADPASIVSTPESILVLHPELRRLKESMIDSAVTLSRQLAQYDASHPRVLGAEAANRALSAELRIQLDSAVKGTEFEREIVNARLVELKNIELDLTQRISNLSAARVDYSDAIHRVDRRKTELARIESELTEIQAAREAASRSGVIAPIGPPKADTRPVGPGRSIIAVAGAGAGFILSVAIIALLFDPRSLSKQGSVETNTAIPHEQPAATRRPAPAAAPVASPATSESRNPEARPSKSESAPVTAGVSPAFSSPRVSESPRTLEPVAVEPQETDAYPTTAISNGPLQIASVDSSLEVERWKAIEQLNEDLASLKTVISERRSKALADELARYQENS